MYGLRSCGSSGRANSRRRPGNWTRQRKTCALGRSPCQLKTRWLWTAQSRSRRRRSWRRIWTPRRKCQQASVPECGRSQVAQPAAHAAPTPRPPPPPASHRPLRLRSRPPRRRCAAAAEGVTTRLRCTTRVQRPGYTCPPRRSMLWRRGAPRSSLACASAPRRRRSAEPTTRRCPRSPPRPRRPVPPCCCPRCGRPLRRRPRRRPRPGKAMEVRAPTEGARALPPAARPAPGPGRSDGWPTLRMHREGQDRQCRRLRRRLRRQRREVCRRRCESS
mmetsp:Transcript_1370/g.5532  ORF Transcript_1370/g.5532 Transcript_1370/m.5532 type:complete len:275 (-) Transcript_1370:594-1418(-)